MSDEQNSAQEQFSQPKAGDPIAMQVVQSPSRTTFFPEQFVVAVTTGEVQVAMLRFEFVPLVQHGVVRDAHGEVMDVEVKNSTMAGQLMDIGHIRMSSKSAEHFTKLVITQLAQSGQLDFNEFAKELTAQLDVTK